jgi:hypothetical protein
MRAFPLLMLLLLAVWAMGAHAEEQIAVGEEGGDYIEADTADYVSGQTLVLTGDVIFHSESAFPGNTVEIHAESAVWDEENGRFSVPAEARMLILEQEVELTGQDLRADLKARTGRMDTVQATVRIDPEMLASESGLTDRTYVRFRGDDPKLHLQAEAVSFSEEGGKPVLMFTGQSGLVAEGEGAYVHPRRSGGAAKRAAGGQRLHRGLHPALPRAPAQDAGFHDHHAADAGAGEGRRVLPQPGDLLRRRQVLSGRLHPVFHEKRRVLDRRVRLQRCG